MREVCLKEVPFDIDDIDEVVLVRGRVWRNRSVRPEGAIEALCGGVQDETSSPLEALVSVPLAIEVVVEHRKLHSTGFYIAEKISFHNTSKKPGILKLTPSFARTSAHTPS